MHRYCGRAQSIDKQNRSCSPMLLFAEETTEVYSSPSRRFICNQIRLSSTRDTFHTRLPIGKPVSVRWGIDGIWIAVDNHNSIHTYIRVIVVGHKRSWFSSFCHKCHYIQSCSITNIRRADVISQCTRDMMWMIFFAINEEFSIIEKIEWRKQTIKPLIL